MTLSRIFERLKTFYLLAALLLTVTVFSSGDHRDSASPFGALEFLEYNHEWNHYQYDTPEKLERTVALMEEAGVGFVRLAFSWNDIEAEAGRFDFTKFDHLVDLLTRHHIKILGFLAFNAPSHGGEWNSSPDEAAYTAYAKATIHRYKDRVKYWEIWNEPDIKNYWTEQDEMKRYTRLLKAVYPVLKKEDPTCTVLLGGLTNAAPFALRRIYEQGGKDSFDIMNFHPYANPLESNALEQVRRVYLSVHKVMEEYNDGEKSIWITEIGCPGLRKGVFSKGWWEGKSPTEGEQASWVTTVLTEPLRWKGIQKVFWAGFRETNDTFHDDVDYFGLIRNDFSKKPGFEAYKEMATRMTKTQ